MKQALSWKTTVFGILAAAASFIVFDPASFAAYPWLLSLAKFVLMGGLAGLGVASKDADVSTPIPPRPPPTELTVTVVPDATKTD